MDMNRDDLTELPYLTMCIRESMRCIPPVSCVSRDLTVPLEVDGVTLLPGTIVDVWIYAVHHNPTVWGDDHMVTIKIYLLHCLFYQVEEW